MRWLATVALLLLLPYGMACTKLWAQPVSSDANAPNAEDSSGPPSPQPPEAAGAGWQSSVDDAARTDAAKKLEDQQRELELSRQQEANLEAGIEQLSRERSQLTDQLVTTAKGVQESEAELSGVEAHLAALTAKETALRASLKLQRNALVKLLAALQRMGRDPPPIMITERADALKMVRSAMQLATVFPQLKDKAVELANNLSTLDATIAGIKAETEQRRADKQKLVEEQQRLDGLLKLKHGELGVRQASLDQLRETVTTQARSVAGLSDLIAKSDRAVAFKGTLGEADKKLQELQPQPDPEPEITALPAAPSPASVANDATAANQAKALGTLQTMPGHGFERARGNLHLPVQGQRILKFGDPTKNVGRSKGEVYTTRASAQITSPCNGLVVYAGDFRTFGQILIINAGGGYHILLAGLGRLDAVTGQAVAAGEPVGKMGAGTGPDANPSSGAPVLYVEFRNRDKPMNPEPWWAGEAEKVQG